MFFMPEIILQYEWKKKCTEFFQLVSDLCSSCGNIQNVKPFSPDYLLLDKVGKHTAILKMYYLLCENFHDLKDWS